MATETEAPADIRTQPDPVGAVVAVLDTSARLVAACRMTQARAVAIHTRSRALIGGRRGGLTPG